MTRLVALLLLAAHARALRPAAQVAGRGAGLRAASALDAEAATVTAADVAGLFGRLADKKLLLNVPFAGTPDMKDCCHGGCDNCDFSRIFDEMNAGRPKWVLCYDYCELIDGRSVAPGWAAMFDAGALARDGFAAALSALPYRPSMGPKVSVDPDEPVSAAAAAALWAALAGDADELTAAQMGDGLKDLCGGAQATGGWGALFSEFEKGLLA